MTPKKDDKGKKEKAKPDKKGEAKGKKEAGKKTKAEKVPEEKPPSKDDFWTPPDASSATPSPAEVPGSNAPAQAVDGESPASQFVTPSATQVIPFYYEQRPLDLALSASEFHQKIQEYGLSKVDIYLPSDEIPKELRRFKTLPPESLDAFERLLADKPPIIKKRILVILQYLYMVTSLV